LADEATPEHVYDRKLGISRADRVFMKANNFTFKVRQGEFRPNGRPYTESGDLGLKPIWIGFTKQKGKFYIELTGMTEEELDIFAKGMEMAINAAREVVQYLDKEAADGYDDDTPYIPLRSLRMTPPYVMREIRPFAGSPMDEDEPPPEVLPDS